MCRDITTGQFNRDDKRSRPSGRTSLQIPAAGRSVVKLFKTCFYYLSLVQYLLLKGVRILNKYFERCLTAAAAEVAPNVEENVTSSVKNLQKKTDLFQLKKVAQLYVQGGLVFVPFLKFIFNFLMKKGVNVSVQLVLQHFYDPGFRRCWRWTSLVDPRGRVHMKLWGMKPWSLSTL